MKAYLKKNHYIMLICTFAMMLIGLVLCINYFTVAKGRPADILANCSLIVAFLAVLWYMLKGYHNSSDAAFRIPMYAYVFCLNIMIATSTASIAATTPFLTFSICTMLIYALIIAFNQHRHKLCMILFAVIIVMEVVHGAAILTVFGPEGIIGGGSLSATLSNIHIFVRSFLTSALCLCYAARIAHQKYQG